MFRFKKTLLAFVFSFFLFSLQARAGIHFQYNSNIHFKTSIEMVPGIMEGFELEENPEVKLLVGHFAKKSFYTQTTAVSDQSLKDSLLENATSLDSINSQRERKNIFFNRTTSAEKIVIQTRYKIIKNDQPWIESNLYIVGKDFSQMASVQFPDDLSPQFKTEILRGFDKIQIERSEPKTVFSTFKEKVFSIAARGTPAFLKSLDKLSSAVIENSYAAETKCNPTDYIKSGVYSTKPGSALYNFNKILGEIESESRKLSAPNQGKKPDESRMSCLTKLYKESKNNAAEYWAKQGVAHDCFNDAASVKGEADLKKMSSTDRNICREVKNSTAYLDKLENDFKKFTDGKSDENFRCDKNPVKPEKQLTDLSTIMGQANKEFCCAEKEGPLYQVVEEDFKKKNKIKGELDKSKNSQVVNECKNNRYSSNDKPGQAFFSKEGAIDCIENFMEGSKDLIISAINSLSALTDFETIKALGQLIMNLPGSAFQILKTMGEQIAAKTYAATNCMSPYDAKMYVCKMVPDVAALLLGPGLIKKFAQAIVSKASTTALAQIVGKAISESASIQKISKASEVVVGAARKVATTVSEVKVIKPTADVLKKVKNALAMDVNTAKDLLAKKVKDLKANRAAVAEAKAAEAAKATEAATKATKTEVAVTAAENKVNDATAKAVEKAESASAVSSDLKAAEHTLAEVKKVEVATPVDAASKEATIAKAEAEISRKSAELEKVTSEASQAGKQLSAEQKALDQAETAQVQAQAQAHVQAQAATAPKLTREMPDYKFETGDKVAVPRTNGKFSEGMVTREIKSESGAIKYELQFQTESGELGRKIIRKEDLHEQYANFYDGKPSTIAKREVPVVERPVVVEKPVVAEKPVTVERPVVVEQPAIAEKPVTVERPVVAEKPVAVERPVVAEKPNPVATEPQLRAISPTEERTFVNKHGVSSSDLNSGREVKVYSSDIAKETEAVVQGRPFEGADGRQYVQVKVETGIETRYGHSNRGKKTYAYENIPVDEVMPGTVKKAPVKIAEPIRDPVAEAAEAAAKAEKAAQDARVAALEKRITETAEANKANAIVASKEPTFVNKHGVARSELNSGKTIKLNSTEVGKEIEGVVQGRPFEGADGRQYVQVKVETGIETSYGHSNRGKKTYAYENVAIDEVMPAPVKKAPVKIAEPVRDPAAEAAEAAAKAEKAAQDARVAKLEKRITDTAETNKANAIASSKETTFVNKHGVARSELNSGATIKLNSMEAGKEIEGIVQGKPFEGVDGRQYVQVKVETGIETSYGHANRGKKTYAYENVAIDEVMPAPVKKAPVKAPEVVDTPVDPQVAATRAAEEARVNDLAKKISKTADDSRAKAIEASKQSTFVNKHGVSRTDLNSGKEFKVYSSDLSKNTKGVVQGRPFEGADGRQYVQVKIETGRERGKPVYSFENIPIDEVMPK